jgi:hypothetical protein
MKEMTGVQLDLFVAGDKELVYLFNEADLAVVADILKAKKKRVRVLTEEQKEQLRNRLKNIR